LRIDPTTIYVTHYMYFEDLDAFEPISRHAFPRRNHRGFAGELTREYKNRLTERSTQASRCMRLGDRREASVLSAALVSKGRLVRPLDTDCRRSR
jgi:hypothetical protein